MPQAWFSHFYAIGLACCFALLLLATPPPGASFASSIEVGHVRGAPNPTPPAPAASLQWQQQQQQRPTPWQLHSHASWPRCAPLAAQAVHYLALWLFWLHLLRRLAETLWLMVYPPDARMHTIAYLFGMSYYVAAPLSLMCPPGTLRACTASGCNAARCTKQPLQCSHTAPAPADHMNGLAACHTGTWLEGCVALAAGRGELLAALAARAAAAPAALGAAVLQAAQPLRVLVSRCGTAATAPARCARLANWPRACAGRGHHGCWLPAAAPLAPPAGRLGSTACGRPRWL